MKRGNDGQSLHAVQAALTWISGLWVAYYPPLPLPEPELPLPAPPPGAAGAAPVEFVLGTVPVTGLEGVAAAGVPIGGVIGPGSLADELMSHPARPRANAADAKIFNADVVFIPRLPFFGPSSRWPSELYA